MASGTGISTARMSDLIGAIYHCVLEPSRWRDVVAAICQEFDFHNGVLAINGFDGQAMLAAIVGVDDYWMGRIMNYGTAVTDLWGGPERIQHYPLEEPIVQSGILSARDRDANPYFVEWARPQGVIDAVVIGLERNDKMVSNVTFARHESRDIFSEADLDALRLLAPHLRRAVNISHVLDLKTFEASTFATALEEFTIGIAFVDHQNTLVHANAAAHALFTQQDPVRLAMGRPALQLAAATNALEEAVRQAAAGEIRPGGRGVGIPAMGRNGKPVIIHVLPLRRGMENLNSHQRPVAALFMTPASSAPQMPAEAIALIYGLTPAEARIFESVAAGEAPLQIANRLGLALSTVKSHLLHVFEKTGCRRQADLVKLAASLSLTI
jgi:DNA-binding CsgD family transcriptional regulator